MKDGISLSVIMPVYNTPEDALDRIVQSILEQETADDINYEIIVIDDGSEAKCAKYLDCLAEQHTTITVYHIPNGGVSHARNKGVELAKGEYITFVDSDDYLNPYFFQQALQTAREYDADAVYGNLEYVPQIYTIRTQNKKEIDRRDTEHLDDIKACLLGYDGGNLKYTIYPGACGKIYRRTIVAKTQFNTELRFAEDLLYAIDTLKYIKVAVVTPYTWYYYVMNDYSATHYNADDNFFARNKCVFDAYQKQFQFESPYICAIARIDFMDIFGSLLLAGYIRPGEKWKKTRKQMAEAMTHPYMQECMQKMKEAYPYMTKKDKIQYFLFYHKLYLGIYLGLKLYDRK